MKMNSKKITALLLSAVMLCGLFAGCKKSEPAENVTENTPAPEQTVQTESAVESEDTSPEDTEETDGDVIYYGESYSQPLEVAAYIYEWEELPPNYITKSEAEKLGFKRILIPKHNLQGLDTKKMKIEIIPVRKVEEAFRALFG